MTSRYLPAQVNVLVEVAEGHSTPAASDTERAEYFVAQLLATLVNAMPQDTLDSLFESQGLRLVGIGGLGPEDQPPGYPGPHVEG